MKHLALNFAAAMGLALCIALVLLQAAGGWSDNSGRTHQLLGRWSFSADADRGLLQLVLFHHSPTRFVGPVLPMGASKEYDAWLKRFPPYVRWYADPFGFECGPNLGTDAARRAIASGTRTWLKAPYWAVQLLLLLPAALIWVPRLLRRRPDPDLCPICGYDLRATPDRCPECGIPATPIHAGAVRGAARDSSPRLPPIKFLIAMLLVAAIL